MTLGGTIENHLIDLLKEAQITSASPGFTNVVKDVRITGLGAEFDRILDMEIAEKISEYISANPDDLREESTFAKSLAARKQNTEKISTGLARKGIGVVQNPANLFGEAIRFLPHASLVALALAIVPFIFDFMTKPGGPLDLRFRRIMSEEISAFLSRQSQRDTEMGTRQVIIQSKTGFTATNGFNNYNTLRGIREGGLNEELMERVGKVDHTKGEWWPFG